MYFFTADEHYFHNNVIRYCNRPFRDINQMHKIMIEGHNKLISNNNIVFHLGDFAFLRPDQISKTSNILSQLNGQHHLILGNHDEGKPFTYLNMGFASVHTSLYVEEFLLVHDPAMAVAVNGDQKVLCGHLHGLTDFVTPNILNVGVDLNHYVPYTIDQVREKYALHKKI